MPTRDERICENLGLVHACAHRFGKKGIDYEDLFSAGCIGLIKAADGFDESRGFAFSTYAVPAILGEIKRLFRDDGMVKVSRSLKEQAMRASKTREALEKSLGREISVKELAEALEISEFETAELLNVMQPVSSLTQMVEGEEGKERDIPTENSEELENRLALSQALDTLESKERTLIELRYFKGMTQTNTAKALGISQVQVSRLERKILLTMRQRLTG